MIWSRKRLRSVEKGGGNYEYFFNKLTSPEWIGPLKKKETLLASPADDSRRYVHSFHAMA